MKIDFEKIINNLNSKANTIYMDKEKLKNLVLKAKEKAEGNKELKSLWEEIKIALELIRDWLKGEYKNLSKSSVIMIIIGFLYLINPLDIIPDFIVGGFLDDAAVLAYIFKKIKDEISEYKKWRRDLGYKEDYTVEIIDVSDENLNDKEN